jgi:hypothetical protein
MQPVVNPIASKEIGIEAIKEAMARLKDVAEAASVVLEDGKVTVGDLKVVPELFADIKDLVAACKEGQAEIKDLNAEEMKIIVADMLDLVLYVAKKFGAQV